jgi:magnesium chelatase family protein
MLTKTHSYGICGLNAYPITVEVDVSKGFPSTIIVGLPDAAVKESKERVRLALKNSGFLFPPGRKTINLSPADTKKEGPSYDLAIAAGLLAASKQIPITGLEHYIFLGELSLDGRIKPVHGSLSVAMALPKKGLTGLVLPQANLSEASLCDGVKLYPVTSLNQAVALLNDPKAVEPHTPRAGQKSFTPTYPVDFQDVQGQSFAKRGLEIAAAGGHNALLIGPPGSGKSMLSQRMPTILPDMTYSECLENTQIYSASGLLDPHRGVITQRPFRAPHHTTSSAAVIGGGSHPKPGEITLSHNGILFLDELPEFKKDVLESLRQPLEDKQVTIARAKKTLRFPADFMLIAAMNPCPCGFYTDKRKECSCSAQQIQRYMAKISGPLLDRIDIHLDVPALAPHDITVRAPQESSARIKQRTVQARRVQQERFRGTPTANNARMSNNQTQEFCCVDAQGEKILRMAIEELGLSARAYFKILKIARTIADLENANEISSLHLTEAIQYRSLDRSRWW